MGKCGHCAAHFGFLACLAKEMAHNFDCPHCIDAATGNPGQIDTEDCGNAMVHRSSTPEPGYENAWPTLGENLHQITHRLPITPLNEWVYTDAVRAYRSVVRNITGKIANAFAKVSWWNVTANEMVTEDLQSVEQLARFEQIGLLIGHCQRKDMHVGDIDSPSPTAMFFEQFHVARSTSAAVVHVNENPQGFCTDGGACFVPKGVQEKAAAKHLLHFRVKAIEQLCGSRLKVVLVMTKPVAA